MMKTINIVFTIITLSLASRVKANDLSELCINPVTMVDFYIKPQTKLKIMFECDVRL